MVFASRELDTVSADTFVDAVSSGSSPARREPGSGGMSTPSFCACDRRCRSEASSMTPVLRSMKGSCLCGGVAGRDGGSWMGRSSSKLSRASSTSDSREPAMSDMAGAGDAVLECRLSEAPRRLLIREKRARRPEISCHVCSEFLGRLWRRGSRSAVAKVSGALNRSIRCDRQHAWDWTANRTAMRLTNVSDAGASKQ